MITIEKLEEILENSKPFKAKGIEYKMKALSLLRYKIPYEICSSIITGAEHDQIYLCDLDNTLPYINEDDAMVLADCNLFIDSDCDCLSMYA